MKRLFIALLSLIVITGVKADEGMWMLPLVEKLNIQKMHNMGCTLKAEEIYSEQQISMKDAVIVFGGGCTGVLVSNQGLVFTNHHCGYGSIQQLSAVEHNYLKDGYTAKELTDEIPVPGLTVKFLVSITDVTERVLGVLNDSMALNIRATKQDSVIKSIKEEFGKDNEYVIEVKSFYSDNEFYVFVMEEFKDIRFAYAPPSSIGKFGGDTDNWMWPRHTGDFSVFRVYADSTGKPVEYSQNNIPYTPKKYIPVSTKGYKEGDFAMIIGNPGTTSRYLTSYGIHNRTEATNQARIDIRGAKQEVWKSFMKDNEAINIAYAGKYARSSNYWKNSIGMNKAIKKLGVIDRKQEEEKAFAAWANETPERKNKYGNVLPEMKENYAKIFPTLHAINYLREALINGVEMPQIASEIEDMMVSEFTTDSIIKATDESYKDYFPEVDKVTLSVMLKTYRKFVDSQYLPAIYQTIDKKFKGNYEAYANYIYEKSDFTDKAKLIKKLQSGKINLKKDPALVFLREVEKTLSNLNNNDYDKGIDIIANAERLFESGLKEINAAKGIKSYPDANFTMRLTYGTIGGYEPADAATFNYYTTTKGILEKEIPGDMEFDVPSNLKTAIINKDFGRFAHPETGEMIVNFLSNNDITGGNSGSPIFNAQGELTGLAFDGNWEAMSGDIVFEAKLQRTINLDVRYLLFVMEKTGNAHRLINELEMH